MLSIYNINKSIEKRIQYFKMLRRERSFVFFQDLLGIFLYYLYVITTFYNISMLQKMLAYLFVALIGTVTAQFTCTLADTSFTFFSVASLQPAQDPNSPLYPNDFFIEVVYSSSHIYTLTSNNIVEVYSKTSPFYSQQTIDQYSYSKNHVYTFTSLTLNKQSTLLVLSSYQSSILNHLIWNIAEDGTLQHSNTTIDHNISHQPDYVFVVEENIHAFFKNTDGNDFIEVVDLVTFNSTTITLNTSNCNIAISPNRQTALLWDQRTEVYIYSTINAFQLQYTYTGSLNSPASRTDSISFSSDSQLALIESDNLNPVRALNLTDYTVRHNITVYGTIYSCTFIDSEPRFLLIKASTGLFISNLETSEQSDPLDTSFADGQFQSDPSFSEIFSVRVESATIYGVNITEGNTSLSSYVIQQDNIDIQQNTTDSIIDNQSIPSQQVPNLAKSFYTEVIYSQGQTTVIESLGTSVETVTNIIEKMFSVIFSTPLAIYFFSIFNYFTLSSLYVFLGIQIPYIVFSYLSILSESVRSDLLAQIGVNIRVPPFSPERVNDPRPLYFQVSSDLFSSNIVSLIIIIANIILFELGILLTSKRLLSFGKLHRFMSRQRISIYWGLIVSNMIPIILPWKYTIFGGTRHCQGKINIAVSTIMLFLLALLVVISLLPEINKARRDKQKGPVKAALRQWWTSYQNYIYPFLLFLDPIYFIVVIGCSNLFVFYNAFYVQKWTFLAVLKSLYPIIFHLCFIIFMTNDQNDILGATSIVCLSVFLIGSAHHLLETGILAVKAIVKAIKKQCKSSQVKPVKGKSTSKTAKNITFSGSQQKSSSISQPKHLKNKTENAIIFKKSLQLPHSQHKDREKSSLKSKPGSHLTTIKTAHKIKTVKDIKKTNSNLLILQQKISAACHS